MNDERKTPRWLFDRLDEVFHFTVDAAATAENRLCWYYWSPDRSGLEQDWTGHTVWCNPPYSRGQLLRWVEKAVTCNDTTVMLLPGDCSTRASQLALQWGDILFLDRRLAFDDEPAGAKFCNWIVLFNGTSLDKVYLKELNLGIVK